MKNIIFVILLISLTGCGTTKAYLGPKKPLEEVAVIYEAKSRGWHNGGHADGLRIEKINDMQVGDPWAGYPKKVEVLPGKVKLKTVYLATTLGKALIMGVGAGVGGAVGAVVTASALENNKESRSPEIIETEVEKGKSYILKYSTKTYSLEDLKIWLEEYQPLK